MGCCIASADNETVRAQSTQSKSITNINLDHLKDQTPEPAITQPRLVQKQENDGITQLPQDGITQPRLAQKHQNDGITQPRLVEQQQQEQITLPRLLGQKDYEIPSSNVVVKKGPQIEPDSILKEELAKTFGVDLTTTNVDCDENEIKENLDKIAPAQVEAVHRVLKTDFYEAQDISEVEVKQKCVSQMEKVNDMNWQYRILQANGRETPINDFESMIIGDRMKDIRNGNRQTMLLSLPCCGMTINLYTSVMTKKNDNKVKLVKKAKTNNRFDRPRPEASDKASAANFVIQVNKGDGEKKNKSFAEESGAYGFKWAEKYKGNRDQFPSFEEMMNGIFKWFSDQMYAEIRSKSKQESHEVIKQHKMTFNALMKHADIYDPHKPLIGFYGHDKDPEKFKDELNLCNPYSQITCFCLYLYSMEFGNPPLYAELNRICREMDESLLETLGPFAKALSWITLCCEHKRNDDDKILTGKILKLKGQGSMGNIAGIFMLFRGAAMRSVWIQPYQDNLYYQKTIESGKEEGRPVYVHIPGNASCSQDIKVALEFATFNLNSDCIPVIFVFSCHNYYSPDGIRMNNEAYTSYPSEREVLLREGCKVYVLAVEKDLLIENEYSSYAPFNGHRVTIVHLFHPW